MIILYKYYKVYSISRRIILGSYLRCMLLSVKHERGSNSRHMYARKTEKIINLRKKKTQKKIYCIKHTLCFYCVK